MKRIFSFLIMIGLPLLACCQNYAKGAKVEIKWGSGWYKGSVVEVKDNAYKVHYDGYKASWDEWVKTDRLRTPGAAPTPATTANADVAKVPADLPIGKYHAFQNNGSGFSFQYTLLLNSLSAYSINGHAGACSYNKASGIIAFTSGPIKGFTGIYRPKNPTNPADPPTIVIDFSGKVPVLNQNHTDNYIYAYLQKK